jgi:hypothetical protein
MARLEFQGEGRVDDSRSTALILGIICSSFCFSSGVAIKPSADSIRSEN